MHEKPMATNEGRQGSMQVGLARTVTPGRLFERLAANPSAGPGAWAILVAGAVWALLSLALATAGWAPSVTLVPIAPERYYLAQAGFVLPLLFAQWGLCSAVALGVARAFGGTGSGSATASTMGFALAAPLLGLFLLPDLLVYGLLGFDALAGLIRITAPLAFVATLALATMAVRVVHHLSAPKAFVAAVAGVLAQAAMGGVLLR
jgi:hypothetical protein